MFEKLKIIKNELRTFSKQERLFVFLTMVTVFFIAGEYSITRPASNSIFIAIFSTKLFPIVWLCTVPVNLAIISLYNKFLAKIGCKKIFFIFGILVIGVNCATALFHKTFSQLIFFQFIFKDIYILLMFKQLWSLIHCTIPKEKAKYLYGAIFGMGGIGSIIGSFLPGFFAVQMGSSNLFYFTIPLYLLIFVFYFLAFQRSHYGSLKLDLGSDKKTFQGVFQSKYLKGVLFLVVFMQVAIALTDFQFNSFIELKIPNQDLRTEFCGKVVGLINILTTSFQFIGGFMLTKFLGIRKSHLLIPTILISNAAVSLFYPTFSMIAYSLVSIKTVDYSLFGIIREMLYTPLNAAEKFKAKAVIDVFAYRTAKALASFIVIILQAFTITYLISYVSVILIFLCSLWLFTVTKLFKLEKAISLG
jgi:ATP:ADP antiporter, AAA family